MAKARTQPLTVSIIGPGRLGTALALSLPKAGAKVKFLVLRSSRNIPQEALNLSRRVRARVVGVDDTPLDTSLVWITVPDDKIAAVAAQLAPTQPWRGKVVFHSSGALTSDALLPLSKRGASVASVHPSMTFVRHSVPRFEGVPFGVEGDATAVRLAREIIDGLGGRCVSIRKQNKVLYHAFGTFASPMLIALIAAMEDVGKAAGISSAHLRTMAAPLLQQTLTNYLEHGAVAASSGPLVRGDVATVRRHLVALRKVLPARDVYLALARVALKNLALKNPKALERELTRE